MVEIPWYDTIRTGSLLLGTCQLHDNLMSNLGDHGKREGAGRPRFTRFIKRFF